MMTELINQKLDQLAGEKDLVKARFQAIDEEVVKRKQVITQEYEEKVAVRDK